MGIRFDLMIDTTDQQGSFVKPSEEPCIQCQTPTKGRYRTATTKAGLAKTKATPVCPKCFKHFSSKHFDKLINK